MNENPWGALLLSVFVILVLACGLTVPAAVGNVLHTNQTRQAEAQAKIATEQRLTAEAQAKQAEEQRRLATIQNEQPVYEAIAGSINAGTTASLADTDAVHPTPSLGIGTIVLLCGVGAVVLVAVIAYVLRRERRMVDALQRIIESREATVLPVAEQGRSLAIPEDDMEVIVVAPFYVTQLR